MATTGIVDAAEASEQLSDLSMASDEPEDVEQNGRAAQLGSLTPEQVQRVLSPPRATPSVGRAMWFKMAHNDQLGTAGWLVFVGIPFILLLISMLVADKLIPWFNRKADGVLTQYLDKMDGLCGSCKLMRVLGFTLPDCDGFTAWGFQNLCEMVDAQRGAEFQAPATWYGTTAQQWPESGNLFARQETSTTVMLFDAQNRLGGNFADPVMARGEQGSPVFESQTMNGIRLVRTFYRFQNDDGKPVNEALRNRQAQISSNHFAIASGAGLFPAMPISVQEIDADSRGRNSFQLVRDMSLVDGYERYDDEAEMDS